MYQKMEAVGDELVITRNNRTERHRFGSHDEAVQRLVIVTEALSWLGTPFVDCGDTRGPNGGVDCAMLLCRSYVDSGRLPSFDPRPYPNQWHLHKGDERFLEWVETKLGGQRVQTPRVGDVLVYQYGRCFSHGAILINKDEIVHAFEKSKICHTSWIKETDLCFIRNGKPRPVLYFEVRS